MHGYPLCEEWPGGRVTTHYYGEHTADRTAAAQTHTHTGAGCAAALGEASAPLWDAAEGGNNCGAPFGSGRSGPRCPETTFEKVLRNKKNTYELFSPVRDSDRRLQWCE